jgi:hypothetical protein
LRQQTDKTIKEETLKKQIDILAVFGMVITFYAGRQGQKSGYRSASFPREVMTLSVMKTGRGLPERKSKAFDGS